MTVWIVAAAMALAAGACIVLPLLRRRNQEDDPAAYDIEVYKDQLHQVGQDYDRGQLSAEQAQAAKTEISRRLLNADARRGSAAFDLDAYCEAAAKFSEVVFALSDVLEEIDLNPVIVHHEGCMAVDALVIVRPPAS